MEKEISRVSRIVVSMLTPQNEERSFTMRYLLEPEDTQGILAIQRAFTEETLRDIASAFQQAVEYIDRS